MIFEKITIIGFLRGKFSYLTINLLTKFVLLIKSFKMSYHGSFYDKVDFYMAAILNLRRRAQNPQGLQPGIIQIWIVGGLRIPKLSLPQIHVLLRGFRSKYTTIPPDYGE